MAFYYVGMFLLGALAGWQLGFLLSTAINIEFIIIIPIIAAILAGIGVGLYQNVQDAYEQVYRPGKIYEPNLELTNKYCQWFKTFEAMYPSLKDLNAQLHNLQA